MTNEEIVRGLLQTAGITPTGDELGRLVAGYGALRRMMDGLHAVDAARYEDMCLTFQADPTFGDWRAT